MPMLDNLIILSLIVGSFFLGRHITIHDYEKLISYYNYFYRMDAAKQGVGYVAPPIKRHRTPIGQDFMDKLHEEGKAVQKFSPSN